MFEIFGQIVAGWLLADFLTGLFHWWQDQWPSASNRFIGAYLIEPSRLHHRNAKAFGDNDFWYRNTATFVGTSCLAWLLIGIFGISVFLIVMALGGMVSTQVHYFAHFPSRANRFVKFIQNVGIIQSPKHHSLHHSFPYSQHYCVLTNWVNPLLDELKMWDRLEKSLTKLHIKLSFGE